MKDLTIIIPARNEEFLSLTVDGILEAKRGNTEIVVVLDGAWADPPLKQHKDLKVIYFPKSVGQRAAMNYAVKVSESKYVMKCDAHCIFDKGFDVVMMNDMQEDWTMVPLMRNVHAFDWVCNGCGHRWYQGPTPTHCCSDNKGKVKNENCNSVDFHRDIIWEAKKTPESTSMRFDSDMKFQYWGGYKAKQKGELVETMSIIGACFMCTRGKYIELDMADEKHGSWGQQGTEVACKTWLSGGKLICNKKTWFAHLFRTQGGDFGFPYKNDSAPRARKYSKDLWLNNKWDKAKYPLSWLIDKFKPPDWNL